MLRPYINLKHAGSIHCQIQNLGQIDSRVICAKEIDGISLSGGRMVEEIWLPPTIAGLLLESTRNVDCPALRLVGGGRCVGRERDQRNRDRGSRNTHS